MTDPTAQPEQPAPAAQPAPIQLVTTDQGPKVGPYIFGKTLGTGSTGKVKLAKNLDTDEIVAIKIVRKDYLENKPSLKKKMRREISVLKVLSHPNLMSLIDVFEIETHLFLVMEFVDGLELFEYLVRRGALPLTEALTFFQQIICGLEYCHNRLICHRDLKPENLLLDRNFNIKIADFGMTSLNRPGKLLETSCGSPHYCDPMVVSGEKYDGLKADIWSCGVILYAMVTGRLPFDDDNIQRLLQKVQVGQYHLPSDLPKDLRDLIKGMLTVDPEQRITLAGIKAHPWFKSIIPRNWVQDNFVAPTEPILEPDAMIVRSLMDLGWGDAEFITTELAKPGPSMEKVFYTQLERHPMFHRSTVTGPKQPAPDGNKAPSKQPEQPSTAVPGEQKPADSAVVKPSVVPTAGASLEQAEVEAKLAAVSVQDGAVQPQSQGEGEGRQEPHSSAADLPAVNPQGGPLVRQSSLLRLNAQAANEAKKREENDDDDVIDNVSVSNQKSWFDSVRNYLTGQQEEAGAERTDNPGENDKPGTG